MNITTDIVATAVESNSKIRLTIEQKNRAIDENIIHYNGVKWKFFDEDIGKLKRLKQVTLAK